MAQVLINESTLTNIANAVRSINGKTTKYKPGELAAAITAETSVALKCIADNTVYTKDTCPYDVADFSCFNLQVIRDYFCYRSDGTTSSEYVGCGSGTGSYIANKLIFPHAKKVGGWAFYSTSFGEIEIPEATEIGKSAFCNGTGFETINLPKVTSLGMFALAYTGLKRVIIPDGVTTIVNSLFKNSINLETIVFGAGLTTLGNAFDYEGSTNFTKLKALYFKSATPPTFNGSGRNLPGGSTTNKLSYTVYVPTGSVAAYQSRFNTYTSTVNFTFVEMNPADMPHYDANGHAVWSN